MYTIYLVWFAVYTLQGKVFVHITRNMRLRYVHNIFGLVCCLHFAGEGFCTYHQEYVHCLGQVFATYSQEYEIVVYCVYTIYLVWFAVYTVRGAGVCIYPRESSWEIYFNLVTIGLLKTGGEETLL